jgi:hypothetical protein
MYGCPQALQEALLSFLFSSPEGFALCRCILKEYLQGICKAFNWVDLLAILATGMGKTGILTMYMLVVLTIKKDPSLCPSAKFLDAF